MATLYGTTANDSIIGSASSDVIYGYAEGTFPENEFGNDYLRGGAGNDRLYGGGGNDTLVGDEGSDTLYGHDGDDLLLGGEGNDHFDGGAGNDTFVITDSKYDGFDGGLGTDTIRLDDHIAYQYLALPLTKAVETLDLNGFILSGSAYGDEFDLSGLVTFNYAGTVIDLGEGNDEFIGFAGADRVRGGNGNDTLVGGGGNDVLSGGNGSDSFDGGAGKDLFLIDDDNSDTFLGGDGFDRVRLEGASVRYRLILDAAAGVERLEQAGFALNGTSSGDIFDFSGLSALVLSGPTIDLGIGNDTYTGFAGSDKVNGGGGSDTLRVGNGNDTLIGSSGSDQLYGEAGNDLFVIGDTYDDSYRGGSGSDTIRLGEAAVRSTLSLDTDASIEKLDLSSFRLSGSSQSDRFDLSGISVLDGKNRLIDLNGGDDLFLGYAGADKVFGDSGNDTLTTGNGDDVIDGGTGADRMNGGSGNDIYTVDDSRDRVIELAGAGDDTVRSWISYSLASDVETLTLVGNDDINGKGNGLANAINGNAGANGLSGAAGNDTISGLGGNDQLAGGAGADELSGGRGNDLFLFKTVADSTVAASGRDRILDFGGGDRIDLAAIDANSGEGGNSAFTFIGTRDFSGNAGQLRFEALGADLVVYGDVDGNGLADFAIYLNDVESLVKSDFIL